MNEIKEIVQNLIQLNVENKKIVKQIDTIKSKYGLTIDTLCNYKEFDNHIKNIHEFAEDIDTELLFTEMISDPQNISITIRYICNVSRGSDDPIRIAAFNNLINFPDEIVERMHALYAIEQYIVIKKYQDYWFEKYDNKTSVLYFLFKLKFHLLSMENQFKLILKLNNEYYIDELENIKSNAYITQECKDKIDSYLVMQALRKDN